MARRTSQKDKRSGRRIPLPALLLAGFFLIALAALQVYKISTQPYEKIERALEKIARVPPEKEKEALEKIALKKPPVQSPVQKSFLREGETAERIYIPPSNLSPYLGDKNAPLELVVFNDPGCGECNFKVANVVKKARMRGLKVTFKFLPKNPLEVDAGIFQRIAWKEGVFEKFNANLTKSTSGGLGGYVEALEAAGMDIRRLRTTMANDMTVILRELNDDIRLANQLGIEHPPAFVLDGYPLDSAPLKTEQITDYIENLKQGADIQG